MPKKLKRIRKTFTHNGETIDRTFTTQKLANEWYEEMRRRSERVKAGLGVTMDDVPMKVAAAHWILLRSKTSDYWNGDEAKMRRALVPALGDKPVRSITKGDCEGALHGARLDLRLTGATFNRYRMCLHTFFEYLIEEGYRETNPVTKIDRMAEVERGVLVSDEDVLKYLTAARVEKNTWFVPFVVMAMNTGAREGELLAFRWEDYQPEASCMKITRRYQRQLKRVKEGTKGGGGRLIPLNRFTIQTINAYRLTTPHNGPQDLIFHRKGGEVVSSSTLGKIHRRVARAAKISDSVRLYDITRHKFASTLVRETGDMRLVQAVLGHSSTRTTERYAHNDPAHLINKAAEVSVGDDGLIQIH